MKLSRALCAALILCASSYGAVAQIVGPGGVANRLQGNDVHLTPGTALGTGVPNLYFDNYSGADGSGGSFVFGNNNSAGTHREAAYVNGGYVSATAGSEQGLIDFGVWDGALGVNHILTETVAPPLSFGPSEDNIWSLGLSGFRFAHVYSADFVGGGGNLTSTTRQIIPASSLSNLPTGATQYFLLQQSAFEVLTAIPSPLAGTIKNLYIVLAAAPGTGKSYTFTLRVNGSDTSVSCAIADSATTCQDTTHSASISAGQTYTIKSVPASTPTATTAMAGFEFLN